MRLPCRAEPTGLHRVHGSRRNNGRGVLALSFSFSGLSIRIIAQLRNALSFFLRLALSLVEVDGIGSDLLGTQLLLSGENTASFLRTCSTGGFADGGALDSSGYRVRCRSGG